jgi:D-sedoheptulose 7-phosphate isomerase
MMANRQVLPVAGMRVIDGPNPVTPYFDKYFSELARLFDAVAADDLIAAAEVIEAASSAGRKTIVVGNGGSAGIASHVAVDLVKAAGRRAVTFHDPAMITCYANDYGYGNWVAEAMNSYADPGDVAVLISSSGQSENIVNGAKAASEIGLSTITLSGFEESNPLRSMGEVNLWVDSCVYNEVEITHQVWLLAIVDYLIEQDR